MSFSHTLPGEENKKCFARFFMDKAQNNFQSNLQGHAVFDDVEMVEIIIPGDQRTQVTSRVNDRHRQEWAAQYEAFKKGLTPSEEGYPIEHWPPITAAMAANLKAKNIHTVEAMASVADGLLGNIGLGARELRERAQKWLQQAETGKAVDQALAERDDARAANAVLQNQVTELAAAVRKLQKASDEE